MSEDLDKIFFEAVDRVSKTEKTLPPDVLLKLYAFYKQGTKGDSSSIAHTDVNDIRNAFKFNAWIQLNGMSANEAKKAYIALAEEVL